MTMITNKALLNVGTELVLDPVNRTIELVATGNLVLKDGVTWQAFYSRLIDLWTQAAWEVYPFPIYAIDAKSGQWIVGFDGKKYSSWKFKNDATRNALRTGGWEEWSATLALPNLTDTGVCNRIYVGAIGLGSINNGAQPYYQTTAAGTASNFQFTDQPNIGVQVYGDAANGNFDSRAFMRAYVREQGYKFKDSSLADTGQTATGAYIVNFLLSNEVDSKIAAADALMTTAPYNGITVTYFGTNQSKSIDGTNYPYRVVIDGNGATLEQVYTKIQYLLRQNTDIDSGPGTVIGKTASLLMSFQGDTLVTTQGVFVANFNSNQLNSIILTDQNNVPRTYKWVTGATLVPATSLIGAGSYYRVIFTALPGPDNDFGEASAITVNDATGNPMAGTFTGNVTLAYDYDGNTQGGRTPLTDAAITIVFGRPGSAKPTQLDGAFTRTKGLVFNLIPETDRAYI